MPQPVDVYVKCDDLDHIPTLMRANYLYESELLCETLSQGSTVLQVGSMDGERAMQLLEDRPDLKMSGLDIEADLVTIAKQKATDSGIRTELILGDITDPPDLPKFDYVICLNNTLGYIPDQQAALTGMKKLGKQVIVSVYGEKFTDKLAEQYFTLIGLSVKRIQDDIFTMADFATVKRYDKQTVEKWSQDVIDTPAGYLVQL